MKLLVRTLIKLYQLTISPFFGSCCRFYPTCSDYALEVFHKHSFFKAFFLTCKRVVKCNPWHPGGIDPAP